jgi:hypothetical protein
MLAKGLETEKNALQFEMEGCGKIERWLWKVSLKKLFQ